MTHTPNDYAAKYAAASPILAKALAQLDRMQVEKRNPPKTVDGLIKYVDKLQAKIEELRETVGDARYQLTGSTGI